MIFLVLLVCAAQGAVEDAFAKLTAPEVRAVVIHAGDPAKRREVRWVGFMWKDAPPDAA